MDMKKKKSYCLMNCQEPCKNKKHFIMSFMLIILGGALFCL
jgi:hypothetical protein